MSHAGLTEICRARIIPSPSCRKSEHGSTRFCVSPIHSFTPLGMALVAAFSPLPFAPRDSSTQSSFSFHSLHGPGTNSAQKKPSNTFLTRNPERRPNCSSSKRFPLTF